MLLPDFIHYVSWWGRSGGNSSCLTSGTDTRGLCCQDLDAGLLQDLRRWGETQSLWVGAFFNTPTTYLFMCAYQLTSCHWGLWPWSFHLLSLVLCRMLSLLSRNIPAVTLTMKRTMTHSPTHVNRKQQCCVCVLLICSRWESAFLTCLTNLMFPVMALKWQTGFRL